MWRVYAPLTVFLLILHKTPNVEVRINDNSYFENLLMTYQDPPFPLMEDRKTSVEEVIDI